MNLRPIDLGQQYMSVHSNSPTQSNQQSKLQGWKQQQSSANTMLLQRGTASGCQHARPQQCASLRHGGASARPPPHAPHSKHSKVHCQSALVNELQLLAADAGGLNPAALVLPGLGAVTVGAAALKFYLYSQLEVITAKMLGKYVPRGGTGARVIQLGGGTRELYYYPKDVVLVTNVGEKVNKGLMQQAGVTAAVPTIVKQQPITDLRFQPDSSVDAVVALNVLAQLQPQQQQQCLQEISRVLKPGSPLVFVEPLAEGGSPFRGLVRVSGGGGFTQSQLEAWQQGGAFSYVQWDTALTGQDPHAVGVAVRSERSVRSRGDGDDDPSMRQRRKKQPKAAKGFS